MSTGKPIEAARAAGATPFQVIWHAVLPQVMPQLADTTIYRWEYNFRASTVLGAVGAGGIGFELIAALRFLEYAQVSAILICILACVTVVDGHRVPCCARRSSSCVPMPKIVVTHLDFSGGRAACFRELGEVVVNLACGAPGVARRSY